MREKESKQTSLLSWDGKQKSLDDFLEQKEASKNDTSYFFSCGFLAGFLLFWLVAIFGIPVYFEKFSTGLLKILLHRY